MKNSWFYTKYLDDSSEEEKLFYDYMIIKARLLLDKDVDNALEQLKILALRGCLPAMSTYLFRQSPILIDGQVVEYAKTIEKKEEKIPEEWEVCAALHYHDKFSVFGEGLEKIGCVQDLIDYYQMLNGRYEDILYRFGSEEECFSLRLQLDYLKNRLYEKPFSKAIIEAQKGYYKNWCEDNYLKDVNGYLEVLKIGGPVFAGIGTLANIGNGDYYSKEDFLGIVKRTFKERVKENELDLETFYIYCSCQRLNETSRKGVKNSLLGLFVVANAETYFLPPYHFEDPKIINRRKGIEKNV